MRIPYIDIHTHHSGNSEEIISLRSLFLQDIDSTVEITFPFSTAIHPWHSDKIGIAEVGTMLESLCSQKNLIAIGETGLDKICAVDFELQKKVFAIQIDFAQKYHKPIIIHAVKSWNELILLFRRIKVPVILHGYSEGLTLTEQLIGFGCYFSLGKSVLNPSARFKESLKIIPLTSILCETDDSAIPIGEIYRKVASLLNVQIDFLKNQVYENYSTIFPHFSA